MNEVFEENQWFGEPLISEEQSGWIRGPDLCF